MDPAACRVMYIDDRFNTERWISREGLAPTTPQKVTSQSDFSSLPTDLQANVNAFLSVFNQVFVCHSGRSFSTKLSELHDQVKMDCTPIIACFDVGSEAKYDDHFRSRHRFSPASESPLPSPGILRREITFSSESDESYGLQLLSRIASDLQVDEGVRLIIPVAIVQPRRKDSYDYAMESIRLPNIFRAPYGPETSPVTLEDKSDIIDPQIMLQCLDAGALDVVKSPLDKAGIMGLTVHAYRIYKNAKQEQSGFMARTRRSRKQSWVGVEEERPYAYLREAMVKKLLKGICEPQNVIEDYQHRDLFVENHRKELVASSLGKWSFCGHDFSEDELVYAGYYMLNHALKMPALKQWSMPASDLLRFMQGCRIAYNSFVLYHNFRHAVDVLQGVFYFLVQIGTLPPYPVGADPPPFATNKSPIAKLLGPFEALTLLISAIGHDVGHPGVSNMFLVKLNAPLAQLYNDQSVLEAFHCAAYSQILRRHWPSAFQDKAIRRLMISTILATDMGVHSDYMQQLGNLQEKIHESQVTDGWSPKDVEAFRVLTCGLLIKCADISNVARPWRVAEKWTHLLQEEFAHQGEMEQAVGMETTLFGGPPELGNVLKLANGQIGFMTIFAHPLFFNVADIIPALTFAADEILTNKGVWFTKAEQEKKNIIRRKGTGLADGGGSVSPRSQSPISQARRSLLEDGKDKAVKPTKSPLRAQADGLGSPELTQRSDSLKSEQKQTDNNVSNSHSRQSSLAAVAAIATASGNGPNSRRGSGASKSSPPSPRRPSIEGKTSSHTVTNNNRQHPLNEEQSATTQSVPSEIDDPKHISLQIPPASSGSLESDPSSDKRRDNTVSMRAGSSAIPVEIPDQGKADRDATKPPDALSKFSFATSDSNEPVRTYDPQQHYPAVHSTARASAPPQDLEASRRELNISEAMKQPSSVQSDSNTMNTNLRGGGPRGGAEDTNTLTPSHSTEATSCTSERSNEFHPKSSPGRSDMLSIESNKRNQTLSAPNSQGLPSTMSPSSLQGGQAFSITSTKSGSRDGNGSKNDVRVFGNGDMSMDDDRSNKDSRKTSKVMARKVSRIKTNLAFWKKKGSSMNGGDNDQQPVQQQQQQQLRTETQSSSYDSDDVHLDVRDKLNGE